LIGATKARVFLKAMLLVDYQVCTVARTSALSKEACFASTVSLSARQSTREHLPAIVDQGFELMRSNILRRTIHGILVIRGPL
jgi:hypothetical protein